MIKINPSRDSDLLAFIAGAGEMGELTRTFDWSNTPVGPVASWPQSLLTMVITVLNSRYPMLLAWGQDYTFFYNDAYAKMTLGPKHPWALGRSFREVWAEIWSDIGVRAESVLSTGIATWDEGLLLFLERNGFPEETYHTFSYSPVPDGYGNVGGFLCAVTEDTERNIGERRLRILRELAAHTTAEAKSAEDACITSARILENNSKDVPFVLLYLLDSDGKQASLAATAGVEPGTKASPRMIDVTQSENPWPFLQVVNSGCSTLVTDLSTRFPGLFSGPWPEPPSQAIMLPMAKPGQLQLAGFVIVGVSSRRPLDDGYRGFFDLLTIQIATAITNARAYEEERRRAEALTELDRSKTAFFSNVSHEFRTPLTLMLGPIEEMLAKSSETLPQNRQLLEIVHRNGLRLQRLVNTILDFSRIEAGRVQAFFEPTDISSLTTDLASNFRSACEKAGLELIIDCPPLNQSVFLDRSVWEKIVLNLLSNAFKFTFEGKISISIQQSSQAIRMQVTDTGIGIAAEEMPHLFKRFHRIENAKGRTHEGSGIGLALVNELVKLHGGSITAESQIGRGTTFTITIPLGSNHLPIEQVRKREYQANTTEKARPFLEEALRWLPETQNGSVFENTDTDTFLLSSQDNPNRQNSARILIVDDNTDMRQYLARLLAVHYEIKTASNGISALAAVQNFIPDLIVSDAMMPLLDGFGLLKELRANPHTASIPVIMLSARAGEESQVEGLQSGADDYLVKPFSAQVLLASVSANLKMARMRQETNEILRENEERFRTLTTTLSDVIYRMSPDWSELKFLQGREFVGDAFESNRAWLDKYIHPDDQLHVKETIQHAIQTKTVFELEHRVIRIDGTFGWAHSRAIPILDKNGNIVEWFGAASNVTRRKIAEQALLDAARHKDEFLATLAHELRNPLTPLRNGLKIMQLAKGDPQAIENARIVMERQLTQMVRLIDDLLDMNRISHGKIELQKENFELASIIQQAVEATQSTIDAAQHKLQVDIPKTPIYLNADVTRLAQVFSNLLHNATKYTKAGGEIQLSIQQCNDEAIISIRDNGVGIPAHMQPYIFEMFTQVDRQLERSQGGLGIGLSLVKQLVEMHNGTVEVKSDGEDMGSEFTVRLPIALPPLSSYLESGTQNKSIKSKRILVVDDNEDAAMTLTLMLELMGNVTKAAHSGLEAIDVGAAFRPDMILLDIGMPGMNGYETAKAIRKQSWSKNIFLIALTGWGQEQDRRRSHEAGFDLHITKPVQASTLEKLLDGMVSDTA